MNEQDKKLLIKDLCARLPYHPQCYCKWTEKAPNGTDGCVQELSTFVIDEIEIMDDPQFKCEICDVKPCLRPMSSMSDDEKIELREYLGAEEVGCDGFGYMEGGTLEDYVSRIPYSLCNYVIDWLNTHHFDYRGLIENGLGIEAPEGMYNTKTE